MNRHHPDVHHAGNHYLIWDIRHQHWVLPNYAGYTRNLWRAGRYDYINTYRALPDYPIVVVLAPEYDAELTPQFLATADAMMQLRIRAELSHSRKAAA